jgi:phage baseplate assembly protein W
VIGMDRTTGKPLEGLAHLVQSIADILTTPIGSRLQRRDYGSRLPDLIDAPANAATRVQLFAATATALMRWEPRISLQRVQINATDSTNGRFVVDVTCRLVGSDNATSLSVPLSSGAPA